MYAGEVSRPQEETIGKCFNAWSSLICGKPVGMGAGIGTGKGESPRISRKGGPGCGPGQGRRGVYVCVCEQGVFEKGTRWVGMVATAGNEGRTS